MFYTLTHEKFHSYGYQVKQTKEQYRIEVNNDFDAYQNAISILRTINNGYAKLTDYKGDLVTEFEYDDIYSNDWELVYS